jgi:hypothetical protein
MLSGEATNANFITVKILLVQSGHHYNVVGFNLFSPWYCWKLLIWCLNKSLTHSIKWECFYLYLGENNLPLSWWEQFTFILVRTIYFYLGENNLLLSWWEQFTFILMRTIYLYLGENNLPLSWWEQFVLTKIKVNCSHQDKGKLFSPR